MSGINPTSGVSSPGWSPITSPSTSRNRPAEDASFGKMLGNYIDGVNKDQTASLNAIQDLLAGKSDDILPVVSAMAKADLSFKLLMGVRNKVIEAYKQIMNMQV